VAEPTVEQLQQSYREQAAWFRSERNRLLRKADILNRRRILDLGTGPGVMLDELRRRTRGSVIGLDNASDVLALAPASVVCGDARAMPFADAAFDLVFTQMFFLWARPLDTILSEIVRVLEPGGTLIAVAEPDYGGLIEYPGFPGPFARFAASIASEGADTIIARKLGPALQAKGFTVTAGIHPADPLASPRLSAHIHPPGPSDSQPREDELPPAFSFIPYFWFFAQTRIR
jgi:SAM-dependent methyltransferase